MEKSKLILSGPGSGKTTNMIDEIITKLSFLKPNRYMAIITYTNAATEDIRSKLSKKIFIPSNLFIGTIHSFLNRFILMPYAPLFGICPYEMCFIDELSVSDTKYKNYIVKKARDRGIISYDQIEWISNKIICGGKISDITITKKSSDLIIQAISNRLQFIFVDEYQDANIAQHEIFKSIILKGKTDYFYCVGDCEQYIYGFTYYYKNMKQPKFNKIPIKEFENDKNIIKETIKENYRSSDKIVKFLNNFSLIEQIAQKKYSKEIPVYFIEETKIEKIVSHFKELCEQYGIGDQTKFYLSYSSSTFDNLILSEVNKITNKRVRNNAILAEILRYISSILGVSQKKLCEFKNISQIEFRKIGCKILEIIKKQPDISQKEINNTIASIFEMKIEKLCDGKDLIEKINSHFENKKIVNDYFTTIHKAKGLEAEAVLAVAETNTKFEKWLETNRDLRETDNTDQCRIGFVAFSRAKQLLCLACCNDLGSMKEKLNVLSVETIK